MSNWISKSGKEAREEAVKVLEKAKNQEKQKQNESAKKSV